MFDGVITQQVYSQYTADDHEVWRRLHAQQLEQARRYACRSYLDGFTRLGLPSDRVVDLDELNAAIAKRCDWTFVGATGFLPPVEFFRCLRDHRFPITVGVRRMDELRFAELPDIFHDVFGHGPMVVQPEVAAVYELVGEAAMRHAEDDEFLGRMAKLFWSTFEVGLIIEGGEGKAFGGALLSSFQELHHIFIDGAPRTTLSLERMKAWDYEVLEVQHEYVEFESLDQIRALVAELERRHGAGVGAERQVVSS
ncbi:MAG: hypothetical protein KC636_18425 [Myxococcales bacterium]|nr:hypothetical protein [Myxococcales bacterium]